MGNTAAYEKKEYLSVPFEVKAFQDEDPDFFYFEGYASTFGNADSYDDIVVPGAFTKTLKNNPDFKLLWQHSMWEPIGMPTMAMEDSKGLFIKGKLPKADTLVSGRVIPQLKVGSINSMSIGYRTIKCSYKDEDGIDGHTTRMLEEVKLIEVSLVTLPANDQAVVTGFKSSELEEVKSLKEIEVFLKNSGMSAKSAKTLISKIKELSPRDDGDNEQKRDADVQPDLKSKILDELQTLNILINLKG